MEEQLVSFETAQLAKNKGFQEKVQKYYRSDRGQKGYLLGGSYSKGAVKSIPSISYIMDDSNHNITPFGSDQEDFSAPTQSLLQKWLREVKFLYICVKHRILGTPLCPIIEFTSNTEAGERNNKWYPTYEEALEEALLHTLKGLPDEV
jgi:hypothetical protein